MAQDRLGSPPGSQGDRSTTERGIVDARFAEVVAAIGPCSDQEAAAIRTALDELLTLTTRLRRVPLDNADEPEIGFVPYRADD